MSMIAAAEYVDIFGDVVDFVPWSASTPSARPTFEVLRSEAVVPLSLIVWYRRGAAMGLKVGENCMHWAKACLLSTRCGMILLRISTGIGCLELDIGCDESEVWLYA